jgi:hypothetical protein
MILDAHGREMRRKIGFEGGLTGSDARNKSDLISGSFIEPEMQPRQEYAEDDKS